MKERGDFVFLTEFIDPTAMKAVLYFRTAVHLCKDLKFAEKVGQKQINENFLLRLNEFRFILRALESH